MLVSTFVEGLTAWATLATAVGTAGLAAATYVLARTTRADVRAANKQVKEAARQADVAERTLLGQMRPLLIDVPPGLGEEPAAWEIGSGRPKAYRDASRVDVVVGETVSVGVPIRNAWTGLARLRGLGLTTGFPLASVGLITNPNLPAGERTRVTFEVRPEHEGIEQLRELLGGHGVFTVEVAYTDLAGAQMTTTSLHVHWTESSDWFVRQVFTADGNKPDVSIGSAPADGR